MNWKKLVGPLGKKLQLVLNQYKYILLVILAGILLLVLPVFGSDKNQDAAVAAGVGMTSFDLNKLEDDIANALSKIDGAGNVTVVLTVKEGSRQILAQDSESSLKDGNTDLDTATVVVSKGSGYEEVVSVQQIFPKFQGALVVCSGGGNPAVKLKLVEALSALTGLGSDKISICKGK